MSKVFKILISEEKYIYESFRKVLLEYKVYIRRDLNAWVYILKFREREKKRAFCFHFHN